MAGGGASETCLIVSFNFESQDDNCAGLESDRLGAFQGSWGG